MIGALALANWERWKVGSVSRQKKDALFELACRIALLAEEARGSGEGKALAKAAEAERRKCLRFGIEALAGGADAEALDQAYEAEPSMKDLEAGDLLELNLVRAGLKGIALGEHPFIVMRRMTAVLGPDYFDKASVWMTDRLKRRRAKPMALLVPGDFPDVVRTLALDGHSLERVMREGGRGLASAALAGCPQESVELAKPLFGKIGGAVLEDDALYLRGHLSGDEIAQAQSAILELISNLEEGGEVELGEDDELYGDPDFVGELTRAILALDERSLKLVLKAPDPRLLAMAMQGMEPEAHERILSFLAKKDERRVLDAVDSMILLPRREIEEAARALASRIIDTIKKGQVPSAPQIAQFERIRDWPRMD